MSDARAWLAAGEEVLQREGIYLDEQRWSEWLELFAPECEYWVPAWTNERALGTDPQRELSHIYYANRQGLEDRIVRIRTGRSPASSPMPRTAHLVSAVLALEPPTAERLRLRSTWASHVFFPRSRMTYTFFGYAIHELARRESRWVIQRKKTVLQNDFIPTMLDVYCI
ncbi:MAG: aromatic-ring-hydroxylating dioxygenase subunit beta [Betaproteobacteria bacterium]|nr:aromatic-ring-hydroxylating dioxygenase subunit beta [Betaproteobacteria bacterium]